MSSVFWNVEAWLLRVSFTETLQFWLIWIWWCV